MFRVFLQLATFVALSLITGYYFHKNGLNFYIGMLTGGVLQYFINYLYETILSAIVALKNKQIENERIKEFTMQGLEVECPCSRKIKDFVPIRLNTANKYKCSECQKLVSVYIESTTALITEPIQDTDTIKLDNIIKNEFGK
jgi:DNA-directed RNA polymerase subunit RPC12/RpoP